VPLLPGGTLLSQHGRAGSPVSRWRGSAIGQRTSSTLRWSPTGLSRSSLIGRGVDPEVAFAWRQIVASRGRVRVERLAARVEWSRKRLWSRFVSQIGLTPKRAALLIRFDHAAHRLAAGQNVATVASESGYVDQSHLHRDVMAFAGVTPSAVAAAPFLAVDDVAWPAPKRAPGL
jgi:AraC-like DNA-binding protein